MDADGLGVTVVQRPMMKHKFYWMQTLLSCTGLACLMCRLIEQPPGVELKLIYSAAIRLFTSLKSKL
jgi:hypothetical protein